MTSHGVAPMATDENDAAKEAADAPTRSPPPQQQQRVFGRPVETPPPSASVPAGVSYNHCTFNYNYNTAGGETSAASAFARPHDASPPRPAADATTVRAVPPPEQVGARPLR